MCQTYLNGCIINYTEQHMYWNIIVFIKLKKIIIGLWVQHEGYSEKVTKKKNPTSMGRWTYWSPDRFKNVQFIRGIVPVDSRVGANKVRRVGISGFARRPVLRLRTLRKGGEVKPGVPVARTHYGIAKIAKVTAPMYLRSWRKS